ncbi:hypothetical protein ACWCXH_37170 [Kitasatospora sp. NPDC001660]
MPVATATAPRAGVDGDGRLAGGRVQVVQLRGDRLGGHGEDRDGRGGGAQVEGPGGGAYLQNL